MDDALLVHIRETLRDIDDLNQRLNQTQQWKEVTRISPAGDGQRPTSQRGTSECFPWENGA
jgi:hypothetical protein